MISKNFDFWSREFWLPEGVDWEHIEDYEKEENLKAANVQDLIPIIYLTISLYFARILFEISIGKITASFMGIKVRIKEAWRYTRDTLTDALENETHRIATPSIRCETATLSDAYPLFSRQSVAIVCVAKHAVVYWTLYG